MMKRNWEQPKNLIFFYHKNHDDPFNGTSVYDNALLKILGREFKISSIEPVERDRKDARVNGMTSNYFVNLVKNVYLRQLHWLVDIFKGNHLTPPENTVLLVEDIYSAPIPFLVSRLRGYRLIYRAADFGKTYSRELFEHHPVQRFLYSAFRKIIESSMIKNSTLVICPSQSVEQEITKEFSSLNLRTVVFPYIKKMSSKGRLVKETESSTDSDKNVVMLFLGDCRYPPNYEAGKFILNDMVPNLNSIDEDFTVLIVGPSTERLFSSHCPNVKILGAVKNVDALFQKAHIGLAPLKTPGGLSMKIVDYLTHGLRVVATPQAANGIISNGQTRLSEYSDFVKAVKEEIDYARNNGHQKHIISTEVVETYMSDKWEKKLLETVKGL